MRKARSFQSVAIGAVALGTVVLLVMAALYLQYVHYDRVASRHVPPGAALVVRVDVEQVIFYEPIRRHVIPLFGGPGDSPTRADATLSRIEVRSRLRRGDLREIVVARGAARGDWVVVLGGIFPRRGDSDRLTAALCDEPGWSAFGDGGGALHRSGVAVARADDGAVVIASSRGVLDAALPPSGTSERLGLPAKNAGGFALSRDALAELVRWPPVLVSGDLPSKMSRLDSLTGEFAPGERIGVRVTFRAADGQVAVQAADGALELMRQKSRQSESRESALLRGGLDRARVEQRSSAAELSVEWEREEVDYALAALSDAIRARF